MSAQEQDRVDGADGFQAPEIQQAMRKVPQTAHGEPAVWLAGGALAVAVFAIVGMVGLIAYQGGRAFWPDPIAEVTLPDGSKVWGEVQGTSTVPEGQENEGAPTKLVRTENYKWTGAHGRWFEFDTGTPTAYPEWAALAEMLDEGRIVGIPNAFRVDGEVLASEPSTVWDSFLEHHGQVRERYREMQSIRDDELAALSSRQEEGRLEVRRAEMEHGTDSEPHLAAQAEFETLLDELAGEQQLWNGKIAELKEINDRYEVGFLFSDGTQVYRPMAEVVRLVTPNRMSFGEKVATYFDRWWEFLSDRPRHANSQGGIWPALFGTVIMTMIMSIMVVPFGVLAALYLKEYAKPGLFVSLVRIAVNNLAGVPSIVFGVFGLSFFCYIVGAQIDEWFFSANLPNPTYGKGGILWASLTLALLTLPVVIVATEEALSAVPQSMREGSYGCGATRWQTIRRVVLPRAMPGIMTGMILAIARGAGEVAPLMLVGAVKLTQDLPVDLSQAPFLFPERSFMHLGFHIYDLGFQSQDSEAARPMVYATTLLLIAIVVGLNLGAIWIRARLRKRFEAAR